MRRSILFPVGLVMMGSAALAACAPETAGNTSAATADAAVEEVKAREQALLENFAGKDVEQAQSFYADDATLIFPGAQPAQGRAAVEKHLRGMVSDPAFVLTIDNQQTRVAASGDLAYTRGTFSNSYTDPGSKQVMTVTGTYLTVFRKEADGSWKAIEDIATPGPMTPPKAP